MPLSAPALATPTVFNTATAIATASFTPSAGGLLVVHTGVRATALPGVPTIDAVAGLTWTQLTSPTDGLYDTGSGIRHRALAWAAVTPTATAMQVITRSTGAARMVLMVMQITGHGGVPSNAKAAADGTGDPAIVLPATPDAAAAVLAFLSGAGTTVAGNTPAGFTQLDNGTDGAGIAWHCCYRLTGASASIPYTSGYASSAGSAVEVSAPTSAGASRVPSRPANRHMLIR
jgi:hypothetical protein